MNRPLRAGVCVFLSLLVVALFLPGCGSDDNPTKPQPTSVSGNVNKAPIVGASVTIHSLNPDGSINPTVVAGPFTTDANGNFNGSVPVGATGPFAMVSVGGTYTDEATGTMVTVPAGVELDGIYQSGTCAVTPLSHATYLAMTDLVAGGATVSAAVSQSVGSSITSFGFDFTTTVPSDAPNATMSQKKYAALLGGTSTLLNANPALGAFASTPKFDLVIALASDMADGKLDGLDVSGNAIQVPTDATGTTFASLPALSATDLSAWLTAANTYAAGVPTLTGILFTVTTPWNPSAPGGGGGGGGPAGTITFAGSGTPNLPSTTAMPDSNYLYSGTQYVWFDTVQRVEITAVYSTPGTIQTLYVVRSPYVWTSYNAGGIAGVTVVGDSTRFTGAAVQQISPAGTSTLTLTGTLENPTP
ncbi:MAG: hypothetical protein ACRENN_06750 [Candidatus Eiseniibacteriota bacterium]